MSEVLRRKIEAAAGLPPSVLQLRAFWSGLVCAIGDWALDALQIESEPVMQQRLMVSGAEAIAALDEGYATAFSASGSPGLAALTIDRHGALHNAAIRLEQNRDSLIDTSSLFLKLLWEQPAAALWTRLAADLEAHDGGADGAPLSDPASAPGGFAPDSRYLQVDFKIVLGQEASRIRLLFDLGFLERQARADAQSGDRAGADAPGREALRRRVRASTLTLEAVLERMTLSIADCSRLEVGEIVPLSNADPGRLALSVSTVNGTLDIGEGELGVWKRNRALKLTAPLSEDVTRELSQL